MIITEQFYYIKIHQKDRNSWSKINNDPTEASWLREKRWKRDRRDRGRGRGEGEVGQDTKIPLPTPPPSLSRLSRAFRILPFLDNYPTVQPVLNLWARLSRKAPTEWMPGHGEIIFYTQQKRPPARPPPPPTPPPQSSPLAPRCRAIVIAETLPSTYTELAVLLSSFLPSFFYSFSLSLSLVSFVSTAK